MKQLFKNILRYITKTKFGYFAIFLLLLISVMIFSAFSNLGLTIKNIFNNLTVEYNLHNLVINEKYSDNPIEAAKQKEAMQLGLSELEINYRPFNSINVTDSSTNNIYKFIEYLPNYNIDELKIFKEDGLPTSNFGKVTIPTSIKYQEILDIASFDLISNETTNISNISARQKLIYFCINSQWTNSEYLKQFQDVWKEIISSNYKYDPIVGDSSSTTNSKHLVSQYLKSFLIPNNDKYSPIQIRGGRLVFNLSSYNGNIPLYGYFDDPYSNLAVVSDAFLEKNGKEVYSFNQFQKDILKSIDNIDQKKLSDNWMNGNIKDFLNIKNSLEITNFVNQLDKKYTIRINNLPYVIIGTGITPDFLYPIISFSNNIPDPKKECLVYTNKSGYARADLGFGSAPHENFLVARYEGKLSETEILSKVNQLSKKNMSWPSNVIPAYWYNDLNNKMTPSSVRIKFITSIINIFISIAIVIASFVLILVIFTMVIFSKNFIGKNKLSLSILLANGFSKNKILISIAFISSFVCAIACPLGLLAGHYFEFIIFGILSNYWFIPTPIVMYDAGWFIAMIIIPTVFLMLINFIVGYFAMKKNLVNLLKINDELSANKIYIAFSPIIRWTKVLYKYQTSIAFSSLTKMFFIFALTTLSIVSMNIGIGITNKLNNAYQLEMENNRSKFNIDMATPSSQGGQYFGISLNKLGRLSLNKSGKPAFENIDYSNNSFLNNAYKNSVLFRNYQSLHIPTMSDSDEINNNLIYMKNRVQTEELLNYFFGIGSLGVNPWDVFKSISPENQQNESNKLSINLKEKLLVDMRPLNQAWFSRLSNLKYIQPNINANNKNCIEFPTYWVIQNFNDSNYKNWKLSMPTNLKVNGKLVEINPSEVGVLNASELFNENGTYLFSNVNDVIENWDTFASLINNAYQSYAKLNLENGEEIPTNWNDRLKIKYHQELFTQEALNEKPIICDDNQTIIFKVDHSKNKNKYLITYRTMLLSYMTKEIIEDNNIQNLNNNYVFDKFDELSYIQHKYAYKTSSTKVLQALPFTFKTDFLNFILSVYNDLIYFDNFYKIMNNIVILDENDEPYVHVDISYNNNNMQIIGIINQSKYINLKNNSNEIINEKLFINDIDETNTINVIINNYVSNLYKLNINDVFEVKIQNHTDRYKYKDSNSAIRSLDLQTNLSEIELIDNQTIKLRIIDINNTGNGPQIYCSIKNAQKILGLATQDDYENNTNTSSITNDSNFKIGMNNQYNSFGGFNGIYIDKSDPSFLSTTLSIYSQSGLYQGFDTWQSNIELNKLIKNSISKDDLNRHYLANALDINYNDFVNIINKYTTTNDFDQFIERIINVIATKYGKSGFLNSYENVDSLDQQKIMYEELSKTVNQIAIISICLIFTLSALIMLIIASLVINQITRVSAILSTLGYSLKTNTMIFFSIFAPCLILSTIISYPILLLLNSLVKNFILFNVNIFVAIPFNIPTFLTILGFIILLYGCIYLLGLYKFKKNNLVESLKW